MRGSITRKIRRAIKKNGRILLFISCIIIIAYKYNTKARSIYKTGDIAFANIKLADELIMIYEQQLAKVTGAPFLPTYQNYRLRFKLNITSIATHLYGNFESLNRHLQVVCFAKFPSSTTLHEVLSFHLNFSVKMNNVKLTLVNSSIPIETNHSDTINIKVDQTFPLDVVFSFTYQWTDLNQINSFNWPEWPLQKSCIDTIASRIRKTNSKFDDPCLVTNTLSHLTSRQMFLAEKSGILYWLDKQYAATQFKHPFISKAKKRRPSPMEFSMNSSICSSEFNQWISTYQQWHENITTILSYVPMSFEQQRDRILELDIRFMLYEAPSTGVADRTVHLITTYLVAILTKRLLLFDPKWSTFSDVMQSKLNWDQISIIPWFSYLHILNGNLSQNDRKYITSRTHRTSQINIRTHYDYDREFPERILIFQGEVGRTVRLMISNESIYRTFLTNDLRMNPENMFGCLYHSLLIYRLAALVERTSETINTALSHKTFGHSSQQILRVMLSPIFYPVGIQIRSDDSYYNIDIYNKSGGATREKRWTASFQHYIHCAWDIFRGNPEMFNRTVQLPIGFLLSDAIGIRQIFLKRWQLPSYCLNSFENECYNQTHEFHILASPDIVHHISRTSKITLAFQVAMFDVFLFSFCEKHIISTASGFGRIGVYSSLKGRNIYSLIADVALPCQEDSESISLINAANYWSGI